MTAPLTGIHAYYINNKPIYAAFLSDVEAQGGSVAPFPTVGSIPDGYFAQIPWIGVVVVPNPSYEGEPAAYSNVTLQAGNKSYQLQLNSANSFSFAATAYLGSAPHSTSQDYFGVPPFTSTQSMTVTLSYGDVPYTDSVVAPVPPPVGATMWSEIIMNYGNLFVDDVRNQESYNTNPAAFLNESAYYLVASIPRFNKPAEIQSYLGTQSPYQFGEYIWVVPTPVNPVEGETTTTTPTVVNTMLPGYSLCSVVIRATDQFGNPVDTSYLYASYDAQTGEVTFPAGLVFGTEFVIDLYLDGYFINPVSQEMKRILGLCFQEAWENRFTGNWLARAAKPTDRSFSPPNEANWTRAQEEKRRSLTASLNEELNRYEQNCAYRGTVGASQTFSLY